LHRYIYLGLGHWKTCRNWWPWWRRSWWWWTDWWRRGGHIQGYDERPDPFHFQYGVHDDKYYTDFSEVRSGNEAGNIKGEYTVALPDGRIQHVIYHADGNYGGTIMEVNYDGEARHPDVVHHGGHGHGGGIGGGIGGGHGIVG
jgi:hypothetical protein